jgi:hypothetical protein
MAIHGFKLLIRRQNRRLGVTNKSNDMHLSLCHGRGSLYINASLPQAANGRSAVSISALPVPGVGRVEPLADATVVHWLIATRSSQSPTTAFQRNIRCRCLQYRVVLWRRIMAYHFTSSLDTFTQFLLRFYSW